MATATVRRLYLYLAAFVGLQMLAAGVARLLALAGERLLGGAAIGGTSVAALRLGGSLALILVGLPLWAGHWHFAQRDARQPEGQRSALRRLYAYAVLLVAAFVAMFRLQEGLAVLLDGEAARLLLAPLAAALVYGGVWLAHWRSFAADRDVVERAGPPATLRRWYLALIRWVSLALASFGAGVLIHGLLQRFAFAAPGSARQLAMPAAALVSGGLVWLAHEIWARRLVGGPGPLQPDELGSRLGQVYTALVIASSLIAALTGLVALLAAGMRAALGAAGWAAAFADETRAMAALAVAPPLLLYHRAQLFAAAALGGEERAGTARRLIRYLTAAVSLGALYAGLGGLAGTLMRLWLGSEIVGAAWRTPLSWYTATTIVALPTYALASWRSEADVRASAEEERALSRRIYLYAGLLFGLIVTAAMATPLIRQVVVAGMGQARPGAAGEIGRLAAYTLLGLAVTAGYGRLLRRAGAARGAAGTGRLIVLVAGAALREELEAALAHALPGAAVAGFDERDTAERRAALARADLLMLTTAALGDPSLAGFAGPRLLLATPLAGHTLVGARREGAGLAREAARAARDQWLAPAPAPAAIPAPRPV